MLTDPGEDLGKPTLDLSLRVWMSSISLALGLPALTSYLLGPGIDHRSTYRFEMFCVPSHHAEPVMTCGGGNEAVTCRHDIAPLLCLGSKFSPDVGNL